MNQIDNQEITLNKEEIQLLNNQNIIMDLENKIDNNFFKTKEELNKYLIMLKEQNIIDSENMIEFLNQYDNLTKEEPSSLDMTNYKNVELEEQNMLISTKTDEILQTETTNEEMLKEFKEMQNELIAANNNPQVTSEEVFNKLKETKKEEVELISLSEAIERENVDIELLNKIKFLISNKYINPYEYKVSLEESLFYNQETKEIIEVKKNESTNEYEIYKGGELQQGKEENMEIIKDTNKEEMTYENNLDRPKVRRLIKPNNIYNNQAFVKGSFLIITIILSSIFAAGILLLTK